MKTYTRLKRPSGSSPCPRSLIQHGLRHGADREKLVRQNLSAASDRSSRTTHLVRHATLEKADTQLTHRKRELSKLQYGDVQIRLRHYLDTSCKTLNWLRTPRRARRGGRLGRSRSATLDMKYRKPSRVLETRLPHEARSPHRLNESPPMRRDPPRRPLRHQQHQRGLAGP